MIQIRQAIPVSSVTTQGDSDLGDLSNVTCSGDQFAKANTTKKGSNGNRLMTAITLI